MLTPVPGRSAYDSCWHLNVLSLLEQRFFNYLSSRLLSCLLGCGTLLFFLIIQILLLCIRHWCSNKHSSWVHAILTYQYSEWVLFCQKVGRGCAFYIGSHCFQSIPCVVSVSMQCSILCAVLFCFVINYARCASVMLYISFFFPIFFTSLLTQFFDQIFSDFCFSRT